MNETTIKRNEVLLRDQNEWLHFSNPYHVLTAKRLGDVLPMLQEVDRLVQVKRWYAAGFLSYEAAPAFDSALQTHAHLHSILTDGVRKRSAAQVSTAFLDERSSLRSARHTSFPYLWFGLYPPPSPIKLPKPERSKTILDWKPTIDRVTYNKTISQIKDHIADGHTYQVNYTMRLQAEFTESPWNFFLQLAQAQNKHAVYVDTGRYVICSASPELFFEREGDQILCRPMKGTTPRGRTTLEDQERAEWLRNSEKNRAENVMIVDMIRNDLGRIAKTGSIRVPELFTTERYPTLWQITSTVTAQTDRSLTEIFTALFPCASITGAPKVSTMKIIAELESTPRQIYTGAIGYVSPQRKTKFNVAIRTVLIDRENRRAEYGVGGGIVWDSTSADEYQEALLKACLLTEQQPPFSLLETMLWTPEEGFFLSEKHIARMIDSASYFDIPLKKEKLKEYVEQISSSFHTPLRVRVLLDQEGNLSFETKPFTSETTSKALKICIAKKPIDSNNPFLFHKTTQRAVYESAREDCKEYEDVLLYNTAGELTEFTIGNLVVEVDGQWLTPPISCGVLPGTFRAHLVETGQVLERTIPIEHLRNCTALFRVNSIRKWQRVEIEKQLSSYDSSETSRPLF